MMARSPRYSHLHKSQRRKEAQIIAWGVVGFFAAAVFVLQLIAVSTAAQNTESIRKTQSDIERTINVIEDCTDTAGECYQENRQRTQTTIDTLNMATYMAVTCVDREGVQGFEEVLACVLDLANKEKKEKKGS